MKKLVTIALLLGACSSGPGGPACDPGSCAGAGGVCTSDEHCVIPCTSGGCGSLVRCPPGLRCEVDCAEPGSCSGGVDCGDAYTCLVLCRGPDSCANEVTCGPGPCIVECSGDGSCDNGTTCTSSCACDVICSGAGACGNDSICPASCADGPECVSDLAGCNVCD